MIHIKVAVLFLLCGIVVGIATVVITNWIGIRGLW